MVLKTDIRDLELKQLGKFDVILMDPPWEEYSRRMEGRREGGREMRGSKVNREKLEAWSLEEIMNLKIE